MKNLKKKVALLLAVVMMLSLLPMNVFGAGTITPVATPGPGGTFNDIVAWIDLTQLRGLETSGNSLTATVELSTIAWGSQPDGVNFIPFTEADNTRALTVVTSAAVGLTGEFTANFFRANATTGILQIGWTNGTSTQIPMAFSGMIGIPMPAINVEGWAVEPTPTIRVNHAARGDLVPATPIVLQTGQQPAVSFHMGSAVAFGEFGAVTVPNLTIREVRRGSFAAGATVGSEGPLFGVDGLNTNAWGVVQLRLLAPAGYLWGGAASIRGTNGTFPSAEVTDQGPADYFIYGRHAKVVTVHSGPRAGGLAGVPVGEFAIGGLTLIPTQEAAQAATLNIDAAFGRLAGTTPTTYAWTHRNAGAMSRYSADNLRVGERSVPGFTITTVGDTLATAWAGTGTGFNTNAINIISDAPGTWLTSVPVTVEVNHPGVEIFEVRWQYRAAHESFDQWGSFTTHRQGANPTANGTVVTPTMARIVPTNVVNATANRRLFIQLALRVNPEFAVDLSEVMATVTVIGLVNRTVTVPVSQIKYPVSVEASSVVTLPIHGDVLGFIPPTVLPNVTVTETEAGRLGTNSWIYVAVVPTVDGKILTDPLSQLNFSTNLNIRANVTGSLSLRNGERVNNFNQSGATNFPNVPVYRFFIERASSGTPSTITFTANTLSGPFFNVPGVEFNFVVGGNALTHAVRPVAPVGYVAPADIGQSRFDVSPMPFSAVVAQFAGEAPTGDVEPPSQQGPSTPEPVFAVSTIDLASNGVPVIGPGGMVNLRGLVERIALANGLDPQLAVTFVDGVAAFSAPHANGGNVTIQIVNNVATVLIGGQLTPLVVGNTLIDGSWYVPMATFGILFGYMGSTANGGTVNFLA
jgi:hypothetical protein